jgi:hypothetical protein
MSPPKATRRPREPSRNFIVPREKRQGHRSRDRGARPDIEQVERRVVVSDRDNAAGPRYRGGGRRGVGRKLDDLGTRTQATDANRRVPPGLLREETLLDPGTRHEHVGAVDGRHVDHGLARGTGDRVPLGDVGVPHVEHSAFSQRGGDHGFAVVAEGATGDAMVDRSSLLWLYRQIADDIAARIAGRELLPDQPSLGRPAVHCLRRSSDVSRGTTRR